MTFCPSLLTHFFLELLGAGPSLIFWWSPAFAPHPHWLGWRGARAARARSKRVALNRTRGATGHQEVAQVSWPGAFPHLHQLNFLGQGL